VRADARFRTGAAFAAALAAAAARAAGVEPGSAAGDSRELAALAARGAVLDQQADEARAAVRWRLRALERLVVAEELDGPTRARAVAAETRALARELGEARSLGRERAGLAAERVALARAAGADETIGAPPAVVLPVAGAVVARFGVSPDVATGLLLPRAGVRLAAASRSAVRAPLAGLVGRVEAEGEGATVVVEDDAGWTAIVGGLAETDVARGQRVAAGDRLGAASPRAPAAVTLELWRGRRPVDPLLFARAPAPLADSPRLP
jgi:murein hydrolase activator